MRRSAGREAAPHQSSGVATEQTSFPLQLLRLFALSTPVSRRGTRRTAAVAWRAAGGNFCELEAVRQQNLPYTLHPALRKQDFKARRSFLAHFRNHGRFLSSISQKKHDTRGYTTPPADLPPARRFF